MTEKKLLERIVEDIRLVRHKRSPRAGTPGYYRVFINADGNVTVEIFNQHV